MTRSGEGDSASEQDDFDEDERALLEALAAAPPRRVEGPGATLGGYILGRKLGEGGFGTVYDATERATGRRVALKVLREDRPGWLLRFKREFRALAGVLAPGLVRLETLGVHEGRWFFTMELLEGHDLDAALALAPERAPALLAGLARSLATLHGFGFVHRDVKPSNARVTPEGRVVLLDFGLATDAESPSGATTASAGTPRYMAPEQVEGHHAGPATDWYAFGVVLHETLTGRAPFEGEGLSAAVRKVREEAPAVVAPEQPPALVSLCQRLLARDPLARPSGDEVLSTLRAIDGDLTARPALRDEVVGRDRELAVLAEALVDSARVGPTLVTVTGVSGVGKSALVRSFLARATADHPKLVVLSGRCYVHEALPFRALDGAVDQLAAWLSRLPDATREAVLPRDATLLGELFPVLRGLRRRDHPPPQDPARRRHAAVLALRELLGRMAERRPVILALDDVQWGDGESAELLGRVLSPPDAPRVLVVTLARAEEPRAEFPLRWEALRATALAEVSHRALTLAPLNHDDARALAVRHAHGALPSSQAARIAEAALGLPFLVSLLASVARPEDRTAPPLAIALARRMDALAPDVRRLFETVCVASQATPTAALLAAARLPPEHPAPHALCVERLARLTRTEAGFCLEPYHDTLGEALVPMLDERRRREMHLALAAQLTSLPGGAERAAGHLLAAGKRAEAFALLREAADAARAQLAHDHAASLYRRLIAHGVRAGMGNEALDPVRLTLAETLHDAGKNLEAAALFTEVAGRLEEGGARSARRWAARSLMLAGRLRQGIETLGEAEPSLRRLMRRSLARLLVDFALSPLDVRRVRARWERGGAPVVPGEVSDLDLLADATLGGAYGDMVLAGACGLALLSLASRRGTAAHIAMGLSFHATLHTALRGERAADEVRSEFALARSVLAAAPSPVPPIVTLLEGLQLFLLGRAAQCDATLGPMVREDTFDAQSGRLVRSFARITWLASWHYLGYHADLAKELPSAEQEFLEVGSRLGCVAMMGMKAWLLALQGDPERAWSLLDEAEAESLASDTPVNTQWVNLIRFDCGVLAGSSSSVERAAKSLEGGRGVSVGISAGIEGRWFAARYALFQATHQTARRSEHLRAAHRAGRWLLGRYGPAAQGLGASVLAAVAAARGEGEALVRWSHVAREHLQSAGLEGPRFALEHLAARHGLWCGNDERARRAEWLLAHNLGDPDVTLSMYLPTLREAPPARPRARG